MLRIGELFDFDPEIGDAKGRDPEDKRANGPDFAHAFVGAARALGIPTRYVTGYYFGENDTPSFHCWGEALDLGLGWVGFDAARGLCPADRHVRLAIGLDAFSTLPVRASPSEDQPSSGRVKISVADDGAGSQQQSQ
jgi:transglutaminase-like putative cysteine protease